MFAGGCQAGGLSEASGDWSGALLSPLLTRGVTFLEIPIRAVGDSTSVLRTPRTFNSFVRRGAHTLCCRPLSVGRPAALFQAIGDRTCQRALCRPHFEQSLFWE